MDKEVIKMQIRYDFSTGDRLNINIDVNNDDSIKEIERKIDEAVYNNLYKNNPEISNYDLAIKIVREIAEDKTIESNIRMEACNFIIEHG
jgi:hypothetical protein